MTQRKTAGLWRVWRKDGKYEITDEMKQNLQEFYGNYATEEETAGAIRRLYEETGYVMDTHTAMPLRLGFTKNTVRRPKTRQRP